MWLVDEDDEARDYEGEFFERRHVRKTSESAVARMVELFFANVQTSFGLSWLLILLRADGIRAVGLCPDFQSLGQGTQLIRRTEQ
jgi:hypothetical protein